MTLILTRTQADAIARHCEQAYPEERCGALVGRIEGCAYTVVSVAPMRNAGQVRGDWFELDPGENLAVERAARAAGMTVIGYFHSHPDAPCRPSARDRQNAWPVFAYVIVTVASGHASGQACWLLDEASGAFEETEIVISEEEL